MPKFFIDQLEDPRLDRFRDLRLRNPTRYGNFFIAEGRLVVERLLQSRHRTLALLVEHNKDEALLQWVKPETEVLSIPASMVEALIGFDFHRGMMACGERPKIPLLMDAVANLRGSQVTVAAYEVQDPTNLGNMIRTAVAFGAKHMILGPRTADPFSRRVMRVSMGTALEMNFLESRNFASDLQQLEAEHQIPSIAATLAPDAIELWRVPRDAPSIVVMGNEGAGLPLEIQQSCTFRATIPMSEVADSLNVSIATGIFLYELMLKNGNR